MHNPSSTKQLAEQALLHIAITRPLPQGQQLQQKLQQAGFNSICEPLFVIENNTTQAAVGNILNNNAPYAFIFVSVAAVKFAEQALPLTQWQQQHPQTQFFAVGEKTKAALLATGINKVISPAQQNSEGLLALEPLNPVNQQLNGKLIIIVRGKQGREHLATQLRNRGAQVQYLSSYKKVWLQLNANEMLPRWQSAAINCIVITSIALLDRMVHLLSAGIQQRSVKNLNDYTWIVVSERIAKQAQTLQLTNMIITENASDEAIIASLTKYKSKQKNKYNSKQNNSQHSNSKKDRNNS